MLEKEMGINQFSIYSSFGSKQGVFLESVKLYRNKLSGIIDKLKKSQNGKEGIKQFFYDYNEFARESKFEKGCLIANTTNEFANNIEPVVKIELSKFTGEIMALFIRNLKQDTTKTKETVEKQANYLLISKAELSMATRIFDQKQIEDFVEITFENI